MDAGAIPSSPNMMHIVVRRLANGVDRIKLIERAGGPDAALAPLDTRDPRVIDLIRIGRDRLGMAPQTDAAETGVCCIEGDRIHYFVWWAAPNAAWQQLDT